MRMTASAGRQVLETLFAEGMQQMDALDYPPHVRAVMDRYHRRWTVNRSLH